MLKKLQNKFLALEGAVYSKILALEGTFYAFLLWMADGVTAKADMKITVDDALGTGTQSPALDSFNEAVGGLGQAGIKTSRIIATFIFVIGLIIAFCVFFFADAQKRQEAKGNLIAKCFAIVGVFGAIAIVTLLAGIGDGLE